MDLQDFDLRAALAAPQPASRQPAPGVEVFRRAFVPASLVLGALLAFEYGQLQAHVANAWLRASLPTALLFGWIFLVWLAEQLYPARSEWNYRLLSSGAAGWRRFARDLFYVLYVAQVTALLLSFAGDRLKSLPALALWPARAPSAVRVALAFALVELLSYAYHRAAHRVPLLWQFHSTHHVVTELNGVKALRTHPVDNLLFYFVRSAPLLLLGASAGDLVAASYVGSALGILAHANLDLRPGWLGAVINFPSYHAVHHSAELAESNSNYGCHTVLWDRVLGTFRASSASALQVGVRPIGTRTLWQELVWPLYRSVNLDAPKP